MRCAKCKAPDPEPLPPDLYSRRPGYVCSECGAKMRAPGTTSTWIMASLLGAFTAILGVSGVVIAAFAQEEAGFQTEGGLMLMMLGLGVIAVAWYQLRSPVPLDAPPQPSRLGFWLAMVILILTLFGAAYLFFLYFLQEML